MPNVQPKTWPDAVKSFERLFKAHGSLVSHGSRTELGQRPRPNGTYAVRQAADLPLIPGDSVRSHIRAAGGRAVRSILRVVFASRAGAAVAAGGVLADVASDKFYVQGDKYNSQVPYDSVVFLEMFTVPRHGAPESPVVSGAVGGFGLSESQTRGEPSGCSANRGEAAARVMTRWRQALQALTAGRTANSVFFTSGDPPTRRGYADADPEPVEAKPVRLALNAVAARAPRELVGLVYRAANSPTRIAFGTVEHVKGKVYRVTTGRMSASVEVASGTVLFFAVRAAQQVSLAVEKQQLASEFERRTAGQLSSMAARGGSFDRGESEDGASGCDGRSTGTEGEVGEASAGTPTGSDDTEDEVEGEADSDDDDSDDDDSDDDVSAEPEDSEGDGGTATDDAVDETGTDELSKMSDESASDVRMSIDGQSPDESHLLVDATRPRATNTAPPSPAAAAAAAATAAVCRLLEEDVEALRAERRRQDAVLGLVMRDNSRLEHECAVAEATAVRLRERAVEREAINAGLRQQVRRLEKANANRTIAAAAVGGGDERGEANRSPAGAGTSNDGSKSARAAGAPTGGRLLPPAAGHAETFYQRERDEAVALAQQKDEHIIALSSRCAALEAEVAERDAYIAGLPGIAEQPCM